MSDPLHYGEDYTIDDVPDDDSQTVILKSPLDEGFQTSTSGLIWSLGGLSHPGTPLYLWDIWAGDQDNTNGYEAYLGHELGHYIGEWIDIAPDMNLMNGGEWDGTGEMPIELRYRFLPNILRRSRQPRPAGRPKTMGRSSREVTMRNYTTIAAIIAAALVGGASGQDLSGTNNPTVQRLLAVPADLLYRGSSALKDLETQTNLLTDVCQNWRAGGIRFLRYAVDLARSQSQLKRPRFKVTDERVAKALIEALDDGNPDVRRTAADLLEKLFDEGTVRKFGPQIVEVERKVKSSDAMLLLGKTGMKEAALLLQEEKIFRSTSAWETEMALARLGDKECETKFISEYKTEKNLRDKAQLALRLGYIGTENTSRTLAEDLRTPEIVHAGDTHSLRLDIIRALGMSFPDEPALWNLSPLSPVPPDDTYYERIERWAEQKFNISWDKPRPPLFFSFGSP